MTSSPSRRQFILGAALALPSFRRLGAAESQPAEPKARFPFYAMDTGLRGPDVPTLESKVGLLKKLGYWGIDYTLDRQQLPRLLELLDAAGLQLACVYLSPVLEEKFDETLAEPIHRLRGRSTRIEIAIRSRSLKPSDPQGDAKALDLVRRFSDLAADDGPVVSVYPHAGLWTEKVRDGLRLAEASGRRNVGTNFNLVHWAWVKQDEPLDEVLKSALPRLLAVSINGLQGRKIVPLDEGDYDVAKFMATLSRTGYAGPVGFQGFGIPGPSQALLQKSIARWKQLAAD